MVISTALQMPIKREASKKKKKGSFIQESYIKHKISNDLQFNSLEKFKQLTRENVNKLAIYLGLVFEAL